MFLGGDQLKNNLGNSVIIKCHQCGDTNLRYVDSTRTNGYPKTYICGNGHETWGALDDWSIYGQTDTLQTPVNDCCCEGISCDLPTSIMVDFSGLIGVQARESCSHNIYDDIKARVSMPISHCGPCCDVNLPSPNGAWSIDCGCKNASGPCTYSDDTANGDGCVFAYAFVSGETSSTEYYHSIWVGNEIPATRSGDAWYSRNPCGPTYPCIQSGCYAPKIITPGFFAGGYPIAYRTSGPAFITELLSIGGNVWTNNGYSIKFIVEEFATVTYYDPPPPGPESENPDDCGCCLKISRNLYVAKRVHPTATPTANAGFDWSISTEGIGDTSFGWSCLCALCDNGIPAPEPIQLMVFSTGDVGNNTGMFQANGNVPGTIIYGDSGVGMFCSDSNSTLPCSNCNNAVGPVSYSSCDNDGSRRFWPFRVPYYESTIDGRYQLTRSGRQNYPTQDPEIGLGECNCISQPTILYPNGDPFFVCTGDSGVWFSRFPAYCTREVAYPPCLASGTEKCFDVDSRYRVQCANPSDYFIKSLVDTGNTDYLAYRYTFDGINALFTTDLDTLDVIFNPIYDFATSAGQEYDYWKFPTSPNPICAGLDNIGWWPGYGDPNDLPYVWYDKNSADNYNAWDINAGAKGITRAKFGQLFGGPDDQVQQPHCLRRVKNADLSNQYPFYMVNTKDVSDQTLILDRYYPTANNTDYIWKNSLAIDNFIGNQPFITNKGDIGISDFIENRMFPYPFVAHSGSLEEPELIAIIHSASGVGGQIAFQTMPVSYDTNTLIDPAYDVFKPATGICLYKNRVTSHGYGVMYPLIDDPMWDSEFDYPIILPGAGYQIGDQIEFRCWKTLNSNTTEYGKCNGASVTVGIKESIWEEECVETIIATATVTELNDERIRPTTVNQNITNAIINLTIDTNSTTRYYETYRISNVSIITSGPNELVVDDIVIISFTDTDGLGGIVHYDTAPSIRITSVDDQGVINGWIVEEEGEFYKIKRTGGIRWYEFNEMDGGDYLISVGNCPCTYDVCSEDCIGCVSKDIYPSGHNKLEALPKGFPDAPFANCVTSGSADPLWCPNATPITDCGEDCVLTGKWLAMGPSGLGWILLNKDLCAENCSCYSNRFTADPPDAVGDTLTGDCKCITEAGDGPYFIGPWGTGVAATCWPTNTSYEFNPPNYARSACSGNPVTSGVRAFIDGNTVIPPKKPQYKYIWLPSVNDFLNDVETYIPAEATDAEKNAIKDAFLAIEPCNPAKYDRFNRSAKWPTQLNNYLSPCRKSNPGSTVPPGSSRTLDDYCRVYGFYQQRQPSCSVIYRGQYIMRAAQKSADFPALSGPVNGPCDPVMFPNTNHKYTDCEPIIQDIQINLNQLEAQFDISVGAPYDQDYLIPEQLPSPYVGPDGKYEVTADAWNYPSLVGHNNTRFFDHGFYEPNRTSDVIVEELPETPGEDSPVTAINPYFKMYDVDGNDFSPNDIYLSGVLDLPDSRNNCSYSGCIIYQIPVDELYPEVTIPLPPSSLQNNFITDCPYPWENIGVGSGNDAYCMFKNNSAEIVLNEIEMCDHCVGSMLISNRNQCDAYTSGVLDSNCNSIFGTFYPEYGQFFSWTKHYLYNENVNQQGYGLREYLLFRAFGNNADSFSVNSFTNAIDNYLSDFRDRFGNDGMTLYEAIQQDINRSILMNMIFQGSFANDVEGLTKVEVYSLAITTVFGDLPLKTITHLFTEDRCKIKEKTGSIKSLSVQNPGKGYAFEIEERIAPSSVIQNISSGTISITSIAKDIDRRRETYTLNSVNITHAGTGYSVNDIIPISFNDEDYRRGQIFIVDQPSVIVTEVDDDGTITNWSIYNSGEFYKYIGTGFHRAFPVAMVLNNYWDSPSDGRQYFGKHAKLRPIVGVDPTDVNTYGRIKRVDVEFGGIDYVSPGRYWSIDTTMGDYDQYGNIKNGLDITHLADVCKLQINGSGFDSEQVKEYRAWMDYPENNPSGTIYFPEKMAYYSPEQGIGDPFEYSIKYYMNTSGNMNPIKWSDRALSISNIIVSGSCPIDASGGLLGRTYNMALIEEANLLNDRPYIGNCSESQCDELINYSDSGCLQPGAVMPNNQTMQNCGDPCPVFTVYDAHRFNIDHTESIAQSIYAGPSPWIRGCQERLPLDTETKKQFFCYNLGPNVNRGGIMQTAGFINYPMINSSGDKCYNAEYSLYAEFGKWTDLGDYINVPALRVKAITYKMQDPITMTISYNDGQPVDYSNVCTNDSPCDAAALQEICGCNDIEEA